jgi:hypothetical protein
MSGILIGGGSKCDCYNNYIYKGKGDGIESLGLGGYRIYNNIIVNAGRTFCPTDPNQQKHGIYTGDVSTQPNASYYYLFNDIINPKSTGIKFSSVVSKGNLIASNAIINPGLGTSSYIVTNSGSDVLQKNNYKAMNTSGAGFQDTVYILLPGSPLIDAGYSDNKGITIDYYCHPRPYGTTYDIGAQEYNGNMEPPMKGETSGSDEDGGIEMANVAGPLTVDPVAFPNPAEATVTIRYRLDSVSNIIFDIYNMEGNRVYHNEEDNLSADSHELVVNVLDFPEGVYLYSIRVQGQTEDGRHAYSGRFHKIK